MTKSKTQNSDKQIRTEYQADNHTATTKIKSQTLKNCEVSILWLAGDDRAQKYVKILTFLVI